MIEINEQTTRLCDELMEILQTLGQQSGLADVQDLETVEALLTGAVQVTMKAALTLISLIDNLEGGEPHLTMEKLGLD